MKFSVKDILDNSFAVSVNPYRARCIREVFSYYGLPKPMIYNGFRNCDLKQLFNGDEKHRQRYANAYNCSLSHTGVIKMAKCLDLPYVAIFEDDAYPCRDIYKKLEEYSSNIPDDAGLVVLGWSRLVGKRISNNDVYSEFSGKVYGSHAYIIFKSAYDKYLEYYHKHPKVASDMMFNIKPSPFKVYIANKCLFIQYNFQRSNWGCIGYAYSETAKVKSDPNPPLGFDRIESIVDVREFTPPSGPKHASIPPPKNNTRKIQFIMPA